MKPGGPRILVIDDERGAREELGLSIEREGWSYYGAETVEEARAAVGDVDPEVMVLEPGTEGGRGGELLVTLRRDGPWIPLLVFTSDAAVGEDWALEHGASGVFRKEDGLGPLCRRIAELLDARATDRPL